MSRARRQAAAAAVALALAGAAPAASGYDCLSTHGGLDAAANQAAERDPKAAIARLQAALAAPVPAGQNRRARLYVELSNAAIVDDQPALSRSAATRGLAALEDRGERPLVDALSMLEAFAISELGDPRRALELYETIAAGVPESAPYYICVLDELAYMDYRNDRIGPAVTNLVRAYTLAAAPGFEADRANTADELATMFQRLEFTDEALPLAEEALTHFRALGDARGVADALRRRGELFGSVGRFDAAEADLGEALALARKVHDRFRELFTSVSICVTERRAGRFAAAETGCRDAQRVATSFENPLGRRAADLATAELELARSHARLALAALDDLDHVAFGGTTRTFSQRTHLARGQALAAAGDYQGAYAAAERYIAASHESAEAQTAARVAVLRVQFETERAQRDLKLATAGRQLLEQKAASDRAMRNVAIGGSALTLATGALYLAGRRRRLAADQARRDAEQRLDAVGRLTGGVAHDFNNLLTVIQQSVGVLAANPAVGADPLAQGLLRAAREAAATGGAITRQLLAFARQLELRPEIVGLAPFLEQLRPMLERAAGARASVRIRTEAELPSVYVDPAQLATALLNLVVNACDALDAPAPIEIAAQRAAPGGAALPGGGDGVRIDVIDHGRGMSAEVLSHAVEPFYSTKGPGGGSGLGLSVVDGFVRQSGGLLGIASTAGRGTTVTLWLPAVPGVA